MAGEHKTYSILLKKTLLANDDGILEFFTSDFGRVSIFIKKLAQSKKKLQEIDFFRVLELVIFQGRNSKSLKSAHTISLFHKFEENYEINELGFRWLETLHSILPEEKKCNMFFKGIIKLFGNITPQNTPYLDMFFRAKCLIFSGIYPGSIDIKKQDTLDLLKTMNFEDFIEKIQNFKKEDFDNIQNLLLKTERDHL